MRETGPVRHHIVGH